VAELHRFGFNPLQWPNWPGVSQVPAAGILAAEAAWTARSTCVQPWPPSETRPRVHFQTASGIKSGNPKFALPAA